MEDQAAIWERRYAGRPIADSAGTASDFCCTVACLLKPVSRVLELGFGGGGDAAYFAGVGHHVLATDISESAVARARESFAGHDLPLAFEVHDTSKPFDLPDATFDLIYARLSLHYFTAS